MASYSYKCNECEKEFEITHGMNEVVEAKCTKCGSKDVERIYKSTSTIWKCNGAFGKSK